MSDANLTANATASSGNAVLTVAAGGHVDIRVNLVSQDMEALGFDDGARSNNAGLVRIS